MRFEYDVIVIGGGHAGCEAAAASARMGAQTLLVTMNTDRLAVMSCNPAVGGVAKGQIVREIDALGGLMGEITDQTTIQFRMLNRSKGAAMWSPRAQCDRAEFSAEWRKRLESINGLYIWQDSVAELFIEAGRVKGIKTALGAQFYAENVILTAGTFLNGLMHVGRNSATGGRSGDATSTGITEQLRSLGFETGRMKTGTPARIDARTIDFNQLEPQYGDNEPQKFSFLPSSPIVKNQLPCYLTHTNEAVHKVLRTGFADSPLFNGTIEGVGPRYCPSIEDKLRTFANKTSHQLFLEPEGRSTNEYYLNGFSSSLPLNTQVEALQKIRGFENVHIYRSGYAIEYDYFPPTQLHHTLETRLVKGLYFAGQVNGTTGYEEAAAQGFIAGINAALRSRGEQQLILGRDEAYIGVLIDDLVTKGVDEPYRMFTSRAEYRILLRQDNADIRLTPIAIRLGLAIPERIERYTQKIHLIALLSDYLTHTTIAPAEITPYLETKNSSPTTAPKHLSELVVRNELTLTELINAIPSLQNYVNSNNIDVEIISTVEISLKYRGYEERERAIADKLRRLEHINLRADLDYNSISSLTIEARQKLSRHRPATIGSASRLPGVSPADINVLLMLFGR